MESKLVSAFRHYRGRNHSAALSLELARNDVANGVARYGSVPWSGFSRHVAGEITTVESRFFESAAASGLRFVGYADALQRSIDHTGWFTDEFQESKLRGAVFQLPAKDGRARFLPAYQESDNDGYVLDVSRGALVTADWVRSVDYHKRGGMTAPGAFQGFTPSALASLSPRECQDIENESTRDGAAIDADRFAERAAERQREYHEAWHAGQVWQQAGEDVQRLRREALAILRERRAVQGVDAPTLCGVIRSRVESILEKIREAREERESLMDSWSAPAADYAAPSWQRRKAELFDAFRDGAGISA